MSSYSQPYGLTAIHPRPIEVGVFLPGKDKIVVAGKIGQKTEGAWVRQVFVTKSTNCKVKNGKKGEKMK